MSRNTTRFIFLGAVVILVGIALLVFEYERNRPSPFDTVEELPEDVFLPLLEPADESGLAPTLQSIRPASTAVTNSSPSGLPPTRLVIPSIQLDAPVVPVHYKSIVAGGETYYQWLVPQKFAAGWQDESAPLGMPGNTVLNGHHNAYGMVFKNLVQVSVGDVIHVYSDQTLFRYIVVEKMLLPERGQTLETRLENARWLQPSSDERLTLVTCWPADSNTHRVIIVAFPEDALPLSTPDIASQH